MSDQATARMLIIWIDELRAASCALERFRVALKDDDEEYTRLAHEALQASYAALQGANDPQAVLVLCNKPDILTVDKKKRRRKS